ncbi:MAG: DUF3817 domain-containing protein [Ekhidna sp.]|nr:DUF3817 domain-containing protein [Ekhidna sp.]
MLETQETRFRLLAHMEGISFLLILMITMPLKYYYDMPGPNKVIGMAHGLLFVLYILATLQFLLQGKWNFKITFLAILASIVPFGTFYFTAKVQPMV